MSSPRQRFENRIERVEEAHRELRDAAVAFANNDTRWTERYLIRCARKYSNAMRRVGMGSGE